MKRYGINVLLILVLIISLADAKTVGDVDVPDSIMAGKTKLVLNGAGIRINEMYGLKIYVGALYLKAKNSDSNAIVNANDPMAVKMVITSKYSTTENMQEAYGKGFDVSTNGNSSSLKNEINVFNSAFNGTIAKGDVFDYIYTPGKGVEVLKNGSSKGIIKGIAFKKALFGIWLGDKPMYGPLKNSMLGN